MSPALHQAIRGIITNNAEYQVGVGLMDIAGGGVHEYGVTSKFVAASTAKVLVATAYYHLVETGQASLNAYIGGFTAVQHIQQMVKNSNNDSWVLLLGVIGYQRLHAFAASHGISYDGTVNELTPSEMAQILNLLYTRRLIGDSYATQLLSWMQNTNYEALIPAALPNGVDVFHKYGLLYGYLHDAAILVRGERAFVLVVYTLGADARDIPARTEIIHALARSVASEFEQ